MTLTSAKNLLILNDAYKKHSIEEHRLLSPPLTPIEAQPSNPIWNYARKNKRKEFIKSYARMAPYLKPVSSRKLLASGHERVFSLNVYRDVAIEKKKNDDDIRHSIMLNKTVVSLSPKRKPMSEKPTDIKKRKRVGSVLPTGKDAAMAFDAIDIDSSDESFFPEGWLPCPDGLDTVPVKVSWKGAPLQVDHQPYYHRLHKVEANMASILRLSPIQYLKCKRTLILAARTLSYQQIPFTKSVAQKLCRVDVNKTSALWTAFGELGWLETH